jgi:hypothetical protein
MVKLSAHEHGGCLFTKAEHRVSYHDGFLVKCRIIIEALLFSDIEAFCRCAYHFSDNCPSQVCFKLLRIEELALAQRISCAYRIFALLEIVSRIRFLRAQFHAKMAEQCGVVCTAGVELCLLIERMKFCGNLLIAVGYGYVPLPRICRRLLIRRFCFLAAAISFRICP